MRCNLEQREPCEGGDQRIDSFLGETLERYVQLLHLKRITLSCDHFDDVERHVQRRLCRLKHRVHSWRAPGVKVALMDVFQWKDPLLRPLHHRSERLIRKSVARARWRDGRDSIFVALRCRVELISRQRKRYLITMGPLTQLKQRCRCAIMRYCICMVGDEVCWRGGGTELVGIHHLAAHVRHGQEHDTARTDHSQPCLNCSDGVHHVFQDVEGDEGVEGVRLYVVHRLRITHKVNLCCLEAIRSKNCCVVGEIDCARLHAPTKTTRQPRLVSAWHAARSNLSNGPGHPLLGSTTSTPRGHASLGNPLSAYRNMQF
mmetsp:Transcript_35734/g.76288  ORF Transcript_35734/g.76288 Transcript_35734/m.76288 type:complete len:316 (-) Transcript_35734:257-1204(-)